MKWIVALIAGCFLTTAWAEAPADREGGWGSSSAYGRMYNLSTVETVTGGVTKVEEQIPMKGMTYGTVLELRQGDDIVLVHLGPTWFMDHQQACFKVGDDVTVTGSKIIFGGRTVIVASKVQCGDKILILRDAQGIPVWSAWHPIRNLTNNNPAAGVALAEQRRG